MESTNLTLEDYFEFEVETPPMRSIQSWLLLGSLTLGVVFVLINTLLLFRAQRSAFANLYLFPYLWTLLLVHFLALLLLLTTAIHLQRMTWIFGAGLCRFVYGIAYPSNASVPFVLLSGICASMSGKYRVFQRVPVAVGLCVLSGVLGFFNGIIPLFFLWGSGSVCHITPFVNPDVELVHVSLQCLFFYISPLLFSFHLYFGQIWLRSGGLAFPLGVMLLCQWLTWFMHYPDRFMWALSHHPYNYFFLARTTYAYANTIGTGVALGVVLPASLLFFLRRLGATPYEQLISRAIEEIQLTVTEQDTE